MKGTFLTILLFSFILFYLQRQSAFAQFHHRQINQYKDGRAEGLWITYTDSTNQQVESRGKYHRGMEKGKWRFYFEDGTPRRKEHFGKKNIRTRYYYDNGRIKSKGIARLRVEQDQLHYYYQGKWKYYDNTGRLERIIYYDKGEEIRTIKK